MNRNESKWENYGTQRRLVLAVLGFTPFERDAYARCDWSSLPLEIQQRIIDARNARKVKQ